MPLRAESVHTIRLRERLAWLLVKPTHMWTEKEWDYYRTEVSPTIIRALLEIRTP